MMGYYFYYPPENKIFVACEHQPEAEHEDVEPKTDVNLVRRSARIPQALERYDFYIDVEEHVLGDHGEPTNYRAALLDPKSYKWLKPINAEMQSMKDNQVWNLVDLPPNCKTVVSKWLFKKNTDMDGNIDTYKSRLVAKVIMEYLVKISKKARILDLKRRYLKITVLTPYTPYPSRKIQHICACTSQKTTKETRSNTA
ncbi:hypothetical protein Tco_1265802, partial [Tanacetum coccineum]